MTHQYCTLHTHTHTHTRSLVTFTGLIFVPYDTSEQCRAAQPRVSDCLFPMPSASFHISSASFHISSASKQSLSGSLCSCSHTFPPFCNSFTHLTSHSYCYLVLRHQFSHQITKAWCIKIFNKPQGTVISVTAISASAETQTCAQTHFKSLTGKVSLRYGSLSAIIITGRKICMTAWRGEGRKKVERRKEKGVLFDFVKKAF